MAQRHGIEQGLEHRLGQIHTATRHLLADALVVVAAVDGKAVPADSAVVGVEGKGLLDAVQRSLAQVADAVLAGLTVAAEVDRIHDFEQGFPELAFRLARLGDQRRLHHESVVAENPIHPEPAEGRIALLEEATRTGDAVSAESHFENSAVYSAAEYSESLGWVAQVEIDPDRFLGGSSLLPGLLAQSAAGKSQADC